MRKLFLASTTKDPNIIKQIDKFVGGFKRKKIVYIPTAVNGDRPWYDYRKGGSAKLVQTLGADVVFLELEKHTDGEIKETVKSADIIWIAGGMGGYLMYWLRRTGLDKLIPELVNKGTYYIGSSVGAGVCAGTLNVWEWFIADPEPGSSIMPGMGMVDFEIYPHYEDSLLTEIKKHWKEGDLYLLKNGEAITVVGNKIKVLGETRILHNGILMTR
jgi:dipeptidase E